MFLSFSRSSKNIVANWWWTIDKWLLSAIVFLLACGVILSFSASPAVAEGHDWSTYRFVYRHGFYLCVASSGMLFFSLLGLKWIRRLAILGYIGALVLVFATLFLGVEIKGAKRWIDIGIQIQPSEFLKPTFVVITAWLFEMQRRYKNFPGMVASIILCALTCLLLFAQPDYGMMIVVAAVWVIQLFLAGVSLKIVTFFGLLVVLVVGVGYLVVPHVQIRVDQLLSGVFGGEPSYQVKRSLEAFQNGGWFGVGVGEGVVKWHIPDAHTDFIFPVAAEEFGMIFCLMIVGAYALIVLRSMKLSGKDDNMFIVLSVCGLAVSFGLQALVNMASTLQLGPTKGMALPLISYGGSSLLGAAMGMGMLLALTRKNIHAENRDDEG